MAAKRMVAGGAHAGEIVVVRLAYGELLLESIEEICRQRKIRDGVILTGFGSLTDIAVSGAIGASFPPRTFYQRTRPRGVEILAMAGVIANYHVHCHLVLSDRNRAFGGHLERGCRVLSLAEIALMRVTGIKLARLVDATTGQKLLQRVRAYPRDGGASEEGSLHVVAVRIRKSR
ncbi:MAG TPA: PPC domain-containing DNA-binding protein [Burkholderiales bacterium]|nr:PPC domain-containing DNA-binding protein [Burkholderiales bacterium]